MNGNCKNCHLHEKFVELIKYNSLIGSYDDESSWLKNKYWLSLKMVVVQKVGGRTALISLVEFYSKKFR